MKNTATILALKSKFSENIQRFNTNNGRIKMLKNIEFSKHFD